MKAAAALALSLLMIGRGLAALDPDAEADYELRLLKSHVTVIP